MRDSLKDSGLESPSARPTSSSPTPPRLDTPKRQMDPVELAQWVEERAERLRTRWMDELRARDGRWGEDVLELVEEFLELFVEMLPVALGPYRHQVEPLWRQTSELYGSVAAMRGLAAGEAIEEFQYLREAMLRLLYAEPPLEAVDRITLREILRLNRFVDRGVTHASIGHTDALFFALFRGNGVPEQPNSELRTEVREQLELIRSELRDVQRLWRR